MSGGELSGWGRDLFVFVRAHDARECARLYGREVHALAISDLDGDRLRGMELRNVYVEPYIGLSPRIRDSMRFRQRGPGSEGFRIVDDVEGWTAALAKLRGERA